jgi:ATP-dependent Clp protease ATP-binding subunit ClpC
VFERYSDPARQAVELAEVEARRLGHGHLGTEHLLLGIVAEGDSPAAQALMASGATLQGCRELVAEVVGEQHPVSASEDLRFTDRATRVMERAARLARRRRDPHVEVAHLVLSVLDVEGRAGQVLRGLGVDLVALARAVEPGAGGGAVAVAATASPAVAPATVVGPRCGHCEAALEGTLTYRVIPAAIPGGPIRRFAVAYCGACGTAVGTQPA